LQASKNEQRSCLDNIHALFVYEKSIVILKIAKHTSNGDLGNGSVLLGRIPECVNDIFYGRFVCVSEKFPQHQLERFERLGCEGLFPLNLRRFAKKTGHDTTSG